MKTKFTLLIIAGCFSQQAHKRRAAILTITIAGICIKAIFVMSAMMTLITGTGDDIISAKINA